MVKKMSSPQPNHPNPSTPHTIPATTNAQTNTIPQQETPLLTHHQQSSHPKQTSHFTPDPPASNIPPSYRITSYPIDNKTYRLVSLNDDTQDEQQQQDNDNGDNDGQDVDFDNDFREPMINAFFLPRFNLFARRNPPLLRNEQLPHQDRNHQRRRRYNIANPHLNRRNFILRPRKSYLQSLMAYAKKVYIYLKSVQPSTWYEYVPFYNHPPTLQSKYKFISLAILNNSINLQAAIIKALEYNIPLMQIIINPMNQKEEEIVAEKILKKFQIAHFINQNFVLYGDWTYSKYRDIFYKNFTEEMKERLQLNGENESTIELEQQGVKNFQQKGKIVFRKGQRVFAQIDLSYVSQIEHNVLQQRLQQVRNHYYRQKQLYRNPNSLISQPSNIHTNSSITHSSHTGNTSQISQSQQNSQLNNQPHKLSVKEVQEQILNDYLQQKMKEEFLERDRQGQQEYDDDSEQNQMEEQIDRGSRQERYKQIHNTNRRNIQSNQRFDDSSPIISSRKQSKLKFANKKKQLSSQQHQQSNQQLQWEKDSSHQDFRKNKKDSFEQELQQEKRLDGPL